MVQHFCSYFRQFEIYWPRQVKSIRIMSLTNWCLVDYYYVMTKRYVIIRTITISFINRALQHIIWYGLITAETMLIREICSRIWRSIIISGGLGYLTMASLPFAGLSGIRDLCWSWTLNFFIYFFFRISWLIS